MPVFRDSRPRCTILGPFWRFITFASAGIARGPEALHPVLFLWLLAGYWRFVFARRAFH